MLTELVLIIFVILIGRGINHKIMGLFRAQQSENVELPSS